MTRSGAAVERRREAAPIRGVDVTRHEVRFGQLGVVSGVMALADGAHWCGERDRHTISVHLDGRLERFDLEFSGDPTGAAIPSVGDVLIIPAGCRYTARAQGAYAKFVAFDMPPSLIGGAPLAARVGHRDDFIFSSASRLSNLLARPTDGVAALTACAIADALQMHLLETYGRIRPAARRRVLTLGEQALLMEAIRSEIDGQHSLESLAALVDMSVRQFTAAFRGAFGMSPWQYILRARLAEGARRLAEAESPITEIALAVGFATSSHFATAFAGRFGMSPSRYRALRRAGRP